MEDPWMFYVDLAFVLIITSLAAIGLTIGRLRAGALPAAVWFFLLLFFGTWAVGAWLQPIGPRMWGTYWVPYVIAAVGISLLLAAGATIFGGSPHPPQEERAAVKATTYAYVWTAILFALVAIAVRYLGRVWGFLD
jgi:hypothetical protein